MMKSKNQSYVSNIRVGYFTTPTKNWGYEVKTLGKTGKLGIFAFGEKKAEINYMPRNFSDCSKIVNNNQSKKNKKR